jgi:hypothetical protein
MQKETHKKIGEIEIPSSYFELPDEEKSAICIGIFDIMLAMINKNAQPEIDRLMILNKMIESSIITNEQEENYEICALLTDIQKILNA